MTSVDIGRPPRRAVEKPGLLLGQTELSLLQEDEPMEKYSEALTGFDRANKKHAVANRGCWRQVRFGAGDP